MSDYEPSDHESDETGSAQPQAGPSYAPHRHLPKQPFTSIEYPGPVSHPTAILKVVTQADLDECFNTPAAKSVELEMRYRMEEMTDTPVRGMRVANQKLLLKVVKRRKKGDKEGGVFTTEVLGPITQTVRYRFMADYHYTPNPDGRIATLVQSLKDLDYDAILDYSFPDLDEKYIEPSLDENGNPNPIPYRSLLELHPPPIFSERRLPIPYSFKNPNQTVVEEVEDPHKGGTRVRLVNKGRLTGVAMPILSHRHTAEDIPKGPTKAIKDRGSKLDQKLLIKLRGIMEQRPVWQRYALLAQFTEGEKREIVMQKAYIPAVGYTIGAGPFWKSIIKFGYDPCADSNARMYQRLYFYIAVNRNRTTMLKAISMEPGSTETEEVIDKSTHSWWEQEQERRIAEGLRQPLDRTRDYIFDGQVIHRDRPDFQLCDITDPLIRKYIDDPQSWTDTCDPRDGWFTAPAFALIRTLVRLKYVHLRETGEPAPDSVCYDAITEYERVISGGGNEDDDDNDGSDIEMEE